MNLDFTGIELKAYEKNRLNRQHREKIMEARTEYRREAVETAASRVINFIEKKTGINYWHFEKEILEQLEGKE